MRTSDPIEGVIALLPTPFHEDGELDPAALRANIGELAAAGMHGIVIASGIGEVYTLDDSEFCQIVDTAVEASGDMLCIVNCSYQSTAKTIERCRYAERAGIKYALVYPYHYIEARFSKEIFLEWFSHIHSSTNEMQFLILNDFRETKTKIVSWDLYSDLLMRFDRICACIEDVMNISEDSIVALSHCFATYGEKVQFLTRSEAGLMVGMALGANGCLATYGLAMPELLLQLYEACRRKQWDSALQLHHRLTRYPWISNAVGVSLPGQPSSLNPGNFLTSIGNTHVIAGQKVNTVFPGTATISKAMCSAAGRQVGDVRLPMLPPGPEMKAFCKDWLQDIAQSAEPARRLK
jgi:dihydrodipicolinate synthase/N-acetylneuraminate lyase